MKTKKAAVLPAARQIDQRETAYHIYSDKSIEESKERIGELLLYLQRPLSQDRQRKLWRLFESKLRRYYKAISAYRILQNPRGGGFSTVECPNGGQRVCDKGVATE